MSKVGGEEGRGRRGGGGVDEQGRRGGGEGEEGMSKVGCC